MGGLYMFEMPYVLFEWGDFPPPCLMTRWYLNSSGYTDLKSRKDTRHKTTQPRIYAAQTKSSMVAKEIPMKAAIQSPWFCHVQPKSNIFFTPELTSL